MHAQKPIIPFLDHHASRNGVVWIDYAKEGKIMAILLPANTTHIMQPCDNKIDKSFQTAVRNTRDEVLAMASTNLHDKSFKLKLAAAAHAAVTAAGLGVFLQHKRMAYGLSLSRKDAHCRAEP